MSKLNTDRNKQIRKEKKERTKARWAQDLDYLKKQEKCRAILMRGI